MMSPTGSLVTLSDRVQPERGVVGCAGAPVEVSSDELRSSPGEVCGDDPVALVAVDLGRRDQMLATPPTECGATRRPKVASPLRDPAEPQDVPAPLDLDRDDRDPTRGATTPARHLPAGGGPDEQPKRREDPAEAVDCPSGGKRRAARHGSLTHPVRVAFVLSRCQGQPGLR